MEKIPCILNRLRRSHFKQGKIRSEKSKLNQSFCENYSTPRVWTLFSITNTRLILYIKMINGVAFWNVRYLDVISNEFSWAKLNTSNAKQQTVFFTFHLLDFSNIHGMKQYCTSWIDWKKWRRRRRSQCSSQQWCLCRLLLLDFVNLLYPS